MVILAQGRERRRRSPGPLDLRTASQSPRRVSDRLGLANRGPIGSARPSGVPKMYLLVAFWWDLWNRLAVFSCKLLTGRGVGRSKSRRLHHLNCYQHSNCLPIGGRRCSRMARNANLSVHCPAFRTTAYWRQRPCRVTVTAALGAPLSARYVTPNAYRGASVARSRLQTERRMESRSAHVRQGGRETSTSPLTPFRARSPRSSRTARRARYGARARRRAGPSAAGSPGAAPRATGAPGPQG